MKKLLGQLFGITATCILLFIFAIAVGYATIIENDFGTDSAKVLIYNSFWLEVVQVWLALCIFYHFFNYKYINIKKFPGFLFHVSFVIILFGAGLTRYAGFEGVMHIREGNVADEIMTNDIKIKLSASKNGKTYTNSIAKIITQNGKNDFSFDLNVGGKIAKISYIDFYPSAKKVIQNSKNGNAIIDLVFSFQGQSRDFFLEYGNEIDFKNMKISFKNDADYNEKDMLNFFVKDNKIFFKSNVELDFLKMLESTEGKYEANKEYELTTKQLMNFKGLNIVPKSFSAKGEIVWQKDENLKQSNPAALVVNINYENTDKKVTLLALNQTGLEEKVSIANQEFKVKWGRELLKLPFSILLHDFQLERYPGSKSPMSYASEIEVIDKTNNLKMPYRIYMNHVLDYAGFRFFQSSYDQDELGTILSVNKDPGKIPTYIGYFLLGLGLFLNLLNPASRFRTLARLIHEDSLKKIASFVLLFFTTTAMYSNDVLQTTKNINSDFAKSAGELLVQSYDGRVKPLNTVAHDILNKIHRGNIDGIDATKSIISMITRASYWQEVPVIKITDDELKKVLGLDKNAKYASFSSFYDKTNTTYKLRKYSEIANRKALSQRNLFDKDVVKVDERLNIFYYALTGEILRIFPKADDENQKWYSPFEALNQFNDKKEIRDMLMGFFAGIDKAIATNDYKDAYKYLNELKSYQAQYGSSIMPSKTKIQAEVLFNNLKIFQRLTPVYLIAGFLLLLFILAKMLNPRINLNIILKLGLYTNIIAFIFHTFGLALRWYVAGHAPWSNSYESMIYIAWSIIFAGIFFSKHSPIALSLTSLLAGISLFSAHLSWIDPQITSIMPVLKSYWLTIHVSVITASYGFFGLCSLLGIFTLVLFLFKSKNKKLNLRIQSNITEATRINEMSMILGLSLLTLGNFLGGVWANESWGRYWGWDSKETWSLVSILVYTIIVHFRLFASKLNNQYSFAVASMFSYWVIIMTYFGVNFYLSGMHSYAAGDPVPIPTYVYYVAGGMIILAILSFFKRKNAKVL